MCLYVLVYIIMCVQMWGCAVCVCVCVCVYVCVRMFVCVCLQVWLGEGEEYGKGQGHVKFVEKRTFQKWIQYGYWRYSYTTEGEVRKPYTIQLSDHSTQQGGNTVHNRREHSYTTGWEHSTQQGGNTATQQGGNTDNVTLWQILQATVGEQSN